MGCGASTAPAPPPLVKVDPEKFTKIFEKDGIKRMAWLNDEKLLMAYGENSFHDPPLFCVSMDGQIYAAAIEGKVKIFNATDHSEIRNFQIFTNKSSFVTNMSFSPDGKHIAFGDGSSDLEWAVLTVEGNEVYKGRIEAMTQSKTGLYWMQNDQLLVLTPNQGTYYDISAKKELGTFHFPHYEDVNQMSLRFMKSGKILATSKGSSSASKVPRKAFILKKGAGYSLEIAESFQVHDKVGPDFPHFLSDEQTLIYERAWGPDQLLCHQLGGEPIVLTRGPRKSSELTTLEEVVGNSSDTILATIDNVGVKLFDLGRETKKSAPADQ
eukprot:symbB.v1.2.019409.t1/scaffold1587.1/size141350/6